MRKILVGVGSIAAAVLAISSAGAQNTIKIGVIMPYSGQFADTATQMDNGIKLYMKRHGDTIAGKKIEIIRKDTGGVAPDVAKRLAQELVVRDRVDLLAGFVLTPNALAASDISDQAKKLMVIMNAATSIITTKSPYSVRVSLTLPQVVRTFGAWAATRAASQDLHLGVGLRPGPRLRGRLPERLQGRRRRDRRRGADAGGQSGFLRLRATREGSQSGIDLHVRAGGRAAGGVRQGAGRARHRCHQDQGVRHRRGRRTRPR